MQIPTQTEMGEWVDWAKSVPDAKILDLANTDMSLDPLRLFGRDGSSDGAVAADAVAERVPTSEQEVVLGEVRGYLARPKRVFIDRIPAVAQGRRMNPPL